MLRSFKPILIFATLALGFFAFGAKASAANNVNGYAWSDSAGWISMNCLNNASCGTVEYGVNLDEVSGAMSGYGWSDNMGWVRFDPPVMTPTFTTNRMGPARVIAIATPGTNAVAGWIRFCSDFNRSDLPDTCGSGTNAVTSQNGGWNGWVAMSGKTQNGIDFGVTFNADTGLFSGFAWGGTVNLPGSEVVGWISFDGVWVQPKNPVSYQPIIDLSTPIDPAIVSTGGTATVRFKWLNPDNLGNHKFTQCNIFSDTFTDRQPYPGAVQGWDNQTFDQNNPNSLQLPSFTNQSGSRDNIFIYGPSTTYFLICQNVEGVRAVDDEAAPGAVCNPFNPAQACPKIKILVEQPVVYTPVIQLTATSNPVQPGDLVELNYRWTNNDGDPAHQFNDCMSFAEYNGGTIDGVTNWTWDTFMIAGTLPVPTSVSQHQSDVQIYGPDTTYYLICSMAGGGNYAVDPSAPPNSACSFSDPATACPRVNVRVDNTIPTDSILLEGKPTMSGSYGIADFSVSSGETINLRWTSSPTPWTTCSAISSPSALGWTGIKGFPPSNQAFVAVPASPTDYTLRCTKVGGATVDSNTIRVTTGTNPPTESLVLMIKLSSNTGGAPYGTMGAPITDVIVPLADTVSLHWESNATIVPDSCSATSSPAGYWNNVPNNPVNPAAYPGAQALNLDLDRTIGSQTRYTITCTDAINGGTLTASATASPLAPNVPAASLIGRSCVRTDTTDFDLGWNTLNLMGGTCALTATPAVAGWDGSVSPLTNNAGATISNLNISGPTTFTLSCQTSGGTAVAPVTHDMIVNQFCTEPPRRSWIFRFFER